MAAVSVKRSIENYTTINTVFTFYRIMSHLSKELEINDTPFGLRVLATDHPVNKSVGSCPKDTPTKELEELITKHESIWMGGSPDWTALQINLVRPRNDRC